jgi:hypothetical protein
MPTRAVENHSSTLSEGEKDTAEILDAVDY